MTENELQQKIFMYFNNNYCLKHHNPRSIIFSVPNGGFRNVIEAKKMKLTGTLSGVSDLILILPNGKLLFLELKIEKGVQSASQKEFEQRVNLLGFEYHIIRSIEQFKELINNG